MALYIGDEYPKLDEPLKYQLEEDVIKVYFEEEIVGIYTYFCSPETIKRDIEEFYENKNNEECLG